MEEKNLNNHILLVEDEKHTRFAVTLVLRMKGFRVTSVSDGTAALKIIENLKNSTDQINFLITDYQINGLNGLELISALKNKKIFIPSVLITGYGNEEILVAVRNKSDIRLLNKPFEPTDLLGVIHRHFIMNREIIEKEVTVF